MLEALLAIAAAGCIACPFNARWAAPDFAHAVRVCQPALVLHDPTPPCNVLPPALAHLPRIVLGNCGGSADVQDGAHTAQRGDGRTYIAPPAHQACAGSSAMARQTDAATAAAEADDRGTSTSASDTSPQQQRSRVPQLLSPTSSPGAVSPPSVHAEALIARRGARGVPCLCLPLATPDCGTALICFTSGTSAAPKGVAITHAALHVQSLAKLAMVGYCAADVYLHSAPLFHIGALVDS